VVTVASVAAAAHVTAVAFVRDGRNGIAPPGSGVAVAMDADASDADASDADAATGKRACTFAMRPA